MNTATKQSNCVTLYKLNGQFFGFEVYQNGFAFTVDGKACSVNEIRDILEGFKDVEGVINDLYQAVREEALRQGFKATARMTIRHD